MNLTFDFILTFAVGARVEIVWKCLSCTESWACRKANQKLTFRRSIFFPRVHRRLDGVLILVNLGRRRWHSVSGNWRCGHRWRCDGGVRRRRLTRCNFRLQRSTRYRRQRIIFLVTTENKILTMIQLKKAHLRIGFRLLLGAVRFAIFLFLVCLLGLRLLASTSQETRDWCSRKKEAELIDSASERSWWRLK